MDARKILPVKLPKLASGKPLRYLGRRVVQAMAEQAVSNFLLGERSVPGKFVVLRLAPSDDERTRLEQEFSESRAAIEREVTREAQARHFRLRAPLELAFLVLTEAELAEEDPALKAAVASAGADLAGLPERLREAEELILSQRTRAVQIESDPPGAAVYLGGRQVERVTPCMVSELPVGEHRLRLVLPGYVMHEGTLVVEETGDRRQRYVARLQPEPPMAVVEVRTFPERALVQMGDETRPSPASFRVPAGRHPLTATLPDYLPASIEVELEPSSPDRPARLSLKLEYAGHDRDEPVGRLIVYEPGRRTPAATPEPANAVAAFFRDRETVPPDTQAVAGERVLTRGVLLIGRDDPRETVRPDVKLSDPWNTVSRGCHAWLHIYSDPGTGADYNTFVIHNSSSSGIRVDGKLITESTALGDDSLIDVGIFKMRVLKQTPEARVEL